jgi:diguanylate cyclase (GGDEF)-like protein
MTAQPARSAGPKAPKPATWDALSEPQRAQIRRLGVALTGRIEDVLERTAARSARSAQQLDAETRESFARVSRASTTALALWLAGGNPEDGRDTGREAFQTYGELAAKRIAPLNEVTKRCLRWRDAVAEVLGESAIEMGIAPAVLQQAVAMVQGTLDVTLVRMSECFEAERKRTDAELAFMATHDALTGLPNKTLIVDRIEQVLLRSRRSHTPVAALLIDLDNFKDINNKLGHSSGDALLRAVAQRLDAVVRDVDALGRLGGDEFVVIVSEFLAGVGPEMIAGRLLDTLKRPFQLEAAETPFSVSASVGIAAAEVTSAEELLRDADVAMYRAKREGKNRYVVFESEMQDAVQGRLELEMDLRDALSKHQFFVVYQPTIDLRDMQPTGVEALIRWRHPGRGVVVPNDFIPLLEDSGLIIEVGRWVLQEACRQGAAWREAGQRIGMAVNVSARQLDTDEFIDDVKDALASSGLDAGALTLEITETALMHDVETTARRLNAIKQLGVRIAIDDFGTGYSSLARLQRFSVDALKIDRSFTATLTQNPEGETLIHTLIQLGKALSIETLAEGIEQQQELSLLQEERCDSGQGFLFARPMEVTAAEEFLEDWGKTTTHLATAARSAGRITE